MNWINSHGFEVLLIFIAVSLITSAMPEKPAHWGFWGTWAYNAVKVLGANATAYIKKTGVDVIDMKDKEDATHAETSGSTKDGVASV
jgi:hypothetical protein